MAKMPIAMLGIDLGKNTCSVAGLDVNGAVKKGANFGGLWPRPERTNARSNSEGASSGPSA